MEYSQNGATTLQYLGSGHTGICFIIFETVLVNFVLSLRIKYLIIKVKQNNKSLGKNQATRKTSKTKRKLLSNLEITIKTLS